MNDQLKNFAKQELKRGLALLQEKSQTIFKRMYSKGKDLSINDVVNQMDEDKLDWAMKQVKRSLEKR